MSRYGSIVDSPCGPLSLVVNEAGAVVRISFEREDLDRDGQARRFRRGHAARDSDLIEDPSRTRGVARQLAEYFARKRQTFDLELAPVGTPFQLAVWRVLSTIPYGETLSYREVALTLGQPEAVRAVGAANGANPIPIVVPCHRVIGSDGTLTGFGGGLDNKRLLLDLEGWRRPATQLSLL